MSYIIKSSSPFVSIKLTESGREKLAKGQLNFTHWAIGDSEINYGRESIVDSNQTDVTLSGTSKILRPFDRQPNIKTFITTLTGGTFNPINPSNISVVKATVNNEATERGTFSGTGMTYTTLNIDGDTYVDWTQSVPNISITGGTSITIPTGSTVSVGQIARLKLVNSTLGLINALENTIPVPNLFYKVESLTNTISGTILTFDRRLPFFGTSGTSTIFFYKYGEVSDTFGSPTSTAYWDSGTLSFDSATNITCSDVKVWNMNNVWCENLAGITGLTTTSIYEDYTKFGSYSYLGTKNPFFEYICQDSQASLAFECNGVGYSYLDDINKSISILHYTNNTISNLYGEFLYIDTVNNKNVVITIPTLMYHRRNYSTSSGTTMGMKFMASGGTKVIGSSNIKYMDLYEDPTMVNDSPLVVGRVFTDLKMIVINDDEIVSAISYKSNRNWTLPPLSATLIAATGGTTTGVLDINKTMYITYALDNLSGTGTTATLPCQTYIKVTNNTATSKDVSFKINDIDQLPYMRKKEAVGYNGMGFYATNFKVLYQIVDNQNDRPNSGSWKVYDYTTTTLTSSVGQTINPIILESQNPTNFIINKLISTATTTYDITVPLSMATNLNPNALQFGDERFFNGNIETYIGATIFKTIFDLRINASQFNKTTNPTRSTQGSTNPPNIKISEIGIYDNNKDLVITGKLSEPVSLIGGDTITLELSMDF